MNADPSARPRAAEEDVGPPAPPVLDQLFDVDGLYQVRAAVAAHATEFGFSAELANDVVIAVHELASNSVRHGAGQGRLRIWAAAQNLICEIADGPVTSQPGAAPRAPDADDLPWPSEPGHGLWLANKVATSLVVRHDDNGTTATVTFLLP